MISILLSVYASDGLRKRALGRARAKGIGRFPLGVYMFSSLEADGTAKQCCVYDTSVHLIRGS